MSAEFIVHKDDDGRFRFQLCLQGDVLLSSWKYKQKAGCRNGIEAVRRASANADAYVKESRARPKHRFILKAANGQRLAISPTYRSPAAYKKAQDAVRQLAPEARVVEPTPQSTGDGHNGSAGRTQAAKPFKIYAAPLGKNGRYGFHDTMTLMIDAYPSRQARDAFWKRTIEPHTETNEQDSSGKQYQYEYMRVDFEGTMPKWPIGEKRYSNTKLISGTDECVQGQLSDSRDVPHEQQRPGH